MRVLISGAGIAGPALAHHLSFLAPPITITMLDRAPSLLPHGQNIDIQGTALRIVKRMGLLPALQRNNTTEAGSQFISPSGKPFAPFPVTKGAEFSLTNEFEILRGDLAKILVEKAVEHKAVDVRFGTTIVSVLENGDERVRVLLSDGSESDYDLLVLCDGQWSRMRKQCFPPESVTPIDKGMYVGYWTVPRIPSDTNWWEIYHALGSRIITLRPDPHGTTRAMLSFMPGTEEEKKTWLAASKAGREAQEELLRRQFADAGWQVDRLLKDMENAEDFYFQAIQQIRMTKWSTGRVVCLGDTAYAPTPLTGMGTSLAITGAYVLAGELSKLEQGEHPVRALEAYEKAFRPFVEESQSIPSFVPAVAHPGSAFKRWIFQTFISTVSMIVKWVVATPWLSKRFQGNDREDFPMPQYSAFVDESETATASKD